MRAYRMEIDIGSAAVKLVLLDGDDQPIYQEYRQRISVARDLELVLFRSFGCGLYSAAESQVSQTLAEYGKRLTILPMDESGNITAAQICIQSIAAAWNRDRELHSASRSRRTVHFPALYAKELPRDGWTILAPQLNSVHFPLLEGAFRKYGYRLVTFDGSPSAAVMTGRQYINNSTCFSAAAAIGQVMETVLSGRYDTDHLAIMVLQTGGCCRVSNYIGFIRYALGKAGMGYIPVISLLSKDMEPNPGFHLALPMALDTGRALSCGDLLLRCLHRVRPYEKEPGSARALCEKWIKVCVQQIVEGEFLYDKTCHEIVRSFDDLPIDESYRRPRVGIVGEILLNMILPAESSLADMLEGEGAEVAAPGLLEYLDYCACSDDDLDNAAGGYSTDAAMDDFFSAIRVPAVKALKISRRFEPPVPMKRAVEKSRSFLSTNNLSSDNRFFAENLAALLTMGITNIVCMRPFACLPNQTTGKELIQALQSKYPQANITLVDYDPDLSEASQRRRIRLLLSVASKSVNTGSGNSSRSTR